MGPKVKTFLCILGLILALAFQCIVAMKIK